MSTYKTKEAIADDRAKFESARYYFNLTDKDNPDDWFETSVINRFEHNIQDVQFNIRMKNDVDFISTVRVPTRCTKCKKVWAIEVQDGAKCRFAPSFLDQSVYRTIPCVKGDCPFPLECKEVK